MTPDELTGVTTSKQLSMPGTPVLRYGEQVGMSEGLSLPGREELRTAMQWDDRPADGFPPRRSICWYVRRLVGAASAHERSMSARNSAIRIR